MTARASARTVAGAAALALVLLAGTAACSSAGPAPGHSGGPTTRAPSSTTPPTPAPASTVTPSSAPATTPSATATAAPSTPSTSAPSSTAGPRSTCTDLTVRVIRGSAAPGYEFAALQFVNTGAARCVLNGYPSVSLLRGGSQVGRPSAPAGSATSSFTLDPGAVAESRLKDYSSCQAPLSDTVRVVAPGSTISAQRPAQLRACRLTVSALATPE